MGVRENIGRVGYTTIRGVQLSILEVSYAEHSLSVDNIMGSRSMMK